MGHSQPGLSAIDEAHGPAEIDPILPDTMAHEITAAKRAALKRLLRQLMLFFVLFLQECVAAGLAGAATKDLKRVKALPDDTHIAV
jgi:hypothetical protein